MRKRDGRLRSPERARDEQRLTYRHVAFEPQGQRAVLPEEHIAREADPLLPDQVGGREVQEVGRSGDEIALLAEHGHRRDPRPRLDDLLEELDALAAAELRDEQPDVSV